MAQEFEKVRVAAGVTNGRGFYCLRHTFAAIADNAVRDDDAIDLVMGHMGKLSMGKTYVGGIYDSRLKAVADAVRSWLFG